MRIETSGSNPGLYPSTTRQDHQTISGFGGSTVAATGVSVPGRPRSGSSTAAQTDAGVGFADPVLEELLESVNRNLWAADKRLQFSIHEGTGRVQLKVIDRATDEVIRELPADKLLDLVERMHDLIGLLIDETA